MNLYFVVQWKRVKYKKEPVGCVELFTNKAKAVVHANLCTRTYPEYVFTVETAPRAGWGRR